MDFTYFHRELSSLKFARKARGDDEGVLRRGWDERILTSERQKVSGAFHAKSISRSDQSATRGSECNPRARAAEIAEEKSNLKLKWGEFVSPLLSYDDSSRVGNETLPGRAITSRFDSDTRRRVAEYSHVSHSLLRPISVSVFDGSVVKS